MCLESLKIHDFILSLKYRIRMGTLSLYKKYDLKFEHEYFLSKEKYDPKKNTK